MADPKTLVADMRRWAAKINTAPGYAPELLRRGAAEIERLQAEVARLQAGLQEIAAMQWDAPAEIARSRLAPPASIASEKETEWEPEPIETDEEEEKLYGTSD